MTLLLAQGPLDVELAIDCITCFMQLVILKVSQWYLLNNEHAAQIIVNLPNLKHLDLQFCKSLVMS